MRKIILLAAILANSAMANDGVKVDTTVVCYPLPSLMAMLKKFGEEPMILGKSAAMDQVVTGVYVNRTTGSYTIVEMDKEAGCVISLGKNVMYRFPKLSSM